MRTEDCTGYSTLYNILSESYSNFMSQSPLANATKRGGGSGSFCCCSGSTAAPVARMIKSEPLGSSSTRWDWAVKYYSGCICATVAQRCQEKLRPFCCSEIWCWRLLLGVGYWCGWRAGDRKRAGSCSQRAFSLLIHLFIYRLQIKKVKSRKGRKRAYFDF